MKREKREDSKLLAGGAFQPSFANLYTVNKHKNAYQMAALWRNLYVVICTYMHASEHHKMIYLQKQGTIASKAGQ